MWALAYHSSPVESQTTSGSQGSPSSMEDTGIKFRSSGLTADAVPSYQSQSLFFLLLGFFFYLFHSFFSFSSFVCFVLFFDRLLVQASLKLCLTLSQPPQCWGVRCVPRCLADAWRTLQPRNHDAITWVHWGSLASLNVTEMSTDTVCLLLRSSLKHPALPRKDTGQRSQQTSQCGLNQALSAVLCVCMFMSVACAHPVCVQGFMEIIPRSCSSDHGPPWFFFFLNIISH